MAMHRRSGFIIVIALWVLAGCASRAPQQQVIVWPSPPDEPRVSYIGFYRGQGDIETPGFLDYLLGRTITMDLPKPYGVYARDSVIYAVDTMRSKVVLLDLKKQQTRFIDGGTVVLQTPIGVAVSADGMIYVSDAKQAKVFLFNQSGVYQGTIGKTEGELKRPAGMAINNDLGRIYICDTGNHAVHVYSLQGERLFSFGKAGSADGEFHMPTNIAVEKSSGNIFVTDTSNFRVQIFDRDGKFKSKFGELGDGFGKFSRPKGIGVDSDGHVYVADAAFNNFQIFNQEGRLLLYVGRGGGAPGAFQLPAGLYIDEQDRIYVADQFNGRIQAFQYFSEQWKKDHPEEYQKYLPLNPEPVKK